MVTRRSKVWKYFHAHFVKIQKAIHYYLVPKIVFLQSNQAKRALQDYINELIIWLFKNTTMKIGRSKNTDNRV